MYVSILLRSVLLPPLLPPPLPPSITRSCGLRPFCIAAFLVRFFIPFAHLPNPLASAPSLLGQLPSSFTPSLPPSRYNSGQPYAHFFFLLLLPLPPALPASLPGRRCSTHLPAARTFSHHTVGILLSISKPFFFILLYFLLLLHSFFIFSSAPTTSSTSVSSSPFCIHE